MLKCLMFLVLFFSGQLGFHLEALAANSVNNNRQKQVSIDKEESLVFVILTHIDKQSQAYLWKRCFESVRKFYPATPIVLIDSNSVFPISDVDLTNTTVIHSAYEAGELLPYYYFMKYKWADKMIFLHDSMFLKRQFTAKELHNRLKFHWQFNVHWFDDDPTINFFLSQLQHGDELIEFNLRKEWYGCFGVASIIALDVLEEIESKYALAETLKDLITSRHQRMALERIFGIIMFKEKYVNFANCSNYGIIHHFPAAFLQVSDERLGEIVKHYPGAIIKTWVGR